MANSQTSAYRHLHMGKFPAPASQGHVTGQYMVVTCLQAMKDFISRQKLGRLATADEIGHLIVYVASDEVRSHYCLLGL